MKRTAVRNLIFLALLFGAAFTLRSQDIVLADSQEETAKPASDTIQGLTVEATKITEAFAESNSLMIEAGKRHFSREVISEYTDEVNVLFSEIRLFMRDTMVIEKNGVSLRELDVITQQIDFYLEEVKRLQKNLSEQTRELNNYTQLLLDNKEDWEQILEAAPLEEIPLDRIGRISRTTERLDSVKTLLQEDLAKIVKEEDRLTDKVNELEKLQVWVEDQRVLVGERFFTRELPGFFESHV